MTALVTSPAQTLAREMTACRLCAGPFAATKTAHPPRPVPWFARENAPVQVIGQAPGLRVHESGRPFDDASGQRLRAWLAVSEDQFWDTGLFSITPMAFCFPGYNAKGHDLPPPKLCAKTWRARLDETLRPRLRLLIGGYAQRAYLPDLPRAARLTDTVKNWRAYAPNGIFPLPHPSWRNTRWIKDNPWFEAELLPDLRTRIALALKESTDDRADA